MSATELAPARSTASPSPVCTDRAPTGRLPVWPLFSLLVLYPLWWAVGLSAFVFLLMAVPMVWFLAHRRPVRLPAGWWWWMLFLVWVLVGVVMVNENVPETLPVGSNVRYLSYGLRVASYLAVTVAMVYAGNLTERELPRLRLVRWLGAFFVTTVVGGLVGTAFPTLTWGSPIAQLFPPAIRNDDYVSQLLTPRVAQIQEIVGFESPRPSAPFTYTNDWGSVFSMLVLWFLVGWLVTGSVRRRTAAVVILAASVVPVVYSLNRGLWLGLGLSVLYVGLRMAARGRLAPLVLGAVAALAALLLLATTSLGQLVEGRVDNPHSNDVRSSLAVAAYEGALRSPVIGWGSGRAVVGSGRSIAGGATEECPQCGNRVIGSQGQFWHVLFSHGFPGVVLYVGFFLHAAWRYRRDHSAIGIAGGLGVLLPLLYMFIYPALTVPLFLSFMALALLWRNDIARQAGVVTRNGAPVVRSGGVS